MPVSIIAVHSGVGAGDSRTAKGPQALAALGLRLWLAELGLSLHWRRISANNQDRAPADADMRLHAVAHVADRVASAVEQTLRAGRRALVLGGDHSIAVGTWSGAANALPSEARLGLVWLDAHMDAHVPETSPSGNWHGMPVAHLLGHGARELTALARAASAVHPKNLCLVGTRSYEPQEAQLLNRLGVRVIAAREIAKRGMTACFAEAFSLTRAGTAAFGLSVDLDVLAPEEAPGVGSPVPGGLSADALIAGLRGLARVPGFMGLEIAEFNPARDDGDRTAAIVRKLLGSVFGAGEGS